ncbi:hypothetical protein NQ317_011557 [Molorchus minor]|uniref:Reverse transcriptase domain-containing protein n=1 Tax=Molorchus minor TaxID=1323400 RepID=A0ABQ9JRL6_9CUCU|nr:hypothetical protein NQ317_011557 [Molorchus minor]
MFTVQNRLHVSNPIVPRLYGLPKIHKPGKSVRPIVSAIGSPTYLLSKNLPIAQSSFSVKNSNEFIKKLNNIQLQDGEILISFDVCSLFPSVPIPQTLDYLRNLLELNNFSQEVVNEYINLTKLCMKQNCFQFNNSFFEQHEGTAMGNSLSPFIANLFMSRFETDIKEEFEYFPRIWIRYVDDIFAVFDTKVESVDSFISKLNSRFTSVNFTYEIENNGQLPFLDVLVIKNNQNNLEFDIYRKDTSTLRYIPNDSHHCYQHKMASLNFLVHGLLSFPLSKERFEKERKLIKDIAKINGYSENCVDRLIMKRNPKDTIGVNDRSGIYEMSCKDCNLKYVGQTRRSILTRFKEHMAHLKYGRTDKSSVAQHAFDNNHRIDINNLKLIRNVTNNRQLDAFESLEIVKCKNRMNSDNGPIPNSPLYWLVRRDDANLVGETRVESVEKSVLVFVEENYFSVRATSKVPAPTGQ